MPFEMKGKSYEGMSYLMNRGEISPPSPQYYNTVLQGYRENDLDESYLQTALENLLYHEQSAEEELDDDFELLKNSFDEAEQFAMDYVDCEEKEYKRMIDELSRE